MMFPSRGIGRIGLLRSSCLCYRSFSSSSFSSSSASSYRSDVIIIGGGIAGASAAYSLSSTHRVQLLEAENVLSYHTTGRSAAIYMESYGNGPNRALTSASKEFLFKPPTGFSDEALVTIRGALRTGKEVEAQAIRDYFSEARLLIPTLRLLNRSEILSLLPIIRPHHAFSAVYEPQAADMDVNAIFQGFIRGMRSRGGQIALNANVKEIKKFGNEWYVKIEDKITKSLKTYNAPIVINAAGAWGDAIGTLAGCKPVGLVPKRRTIVTIPYPSQYSQSGKSWPFCASIDESWYLKPQSDQLLISPADQTPSEACDAIPDELDVAKCIDRLENATTLSIPRISHKWAGLRSFVRDNSPVIGYDDNVENFFWLIGLGGYGIQTSPAISQLVASLVKHQGIPKHIRDMGLTMDQIEVKRLRKSATK